MSSDKLSNSNIREVSDFLADFAISLMGSGTQTARVLRNVNRLAETFGYKIDTIILPRTIILTLATLSGPFEHNTVVRKVRHMPLNFLLLAKLRILSWETYLKKLSFEQCKRSYEEILNTPGISGFPLILTVSCGNAAFSQLFGGFYSIPVVFVGTFFGFWLKDVLLKRRVNALLVVMLSAFVSSFIVAVMAKIFDFKTDIALSTSVLFLIPGVPLINSVIDFIDGHILAGVSRLVNALSTIVALTFGLIATIFLLDINYHLEFSRSAAHSSLLLPLIFDAFFAAIAGMGFGAISNPPRRALLAAGVLAAVGHAFRFYLLNAQGVDITTSTLSAAFVIGLGAFFFGRISKAPAEIFSFPALLPMIPGLMVYRAILSAIKFLKAPDSAAAAAILPDMFSYGFTAIFVMFAIVIGASFSVFLDTLSTRMANPKGMEDDLK